MGHHLRSRPATRIPSLEDLALFEKAAREAFTQGDPAKAWQVMQALLDYAREAVLDGAKWRFKANFGTSVCQTCRGLHAGEGVAATCFQTKRCHYDHLRKDIRDKVVDSMLRTTPKDD